MFRADLGNGGGASFGIIILDDDYVFNNSGIRTLKHEYGHRLHFDEIGADTYLITTAIPSLIFAGLTNEGIFPQEYYYSLPWEYVADMYGGVNRGGYSPYAAENAAIFWTATIIASRYGGLL